MWLQVKAPVTQMHSADVCQLQIFVIIKSQQSFCVPGCSFALTQRGIQGYSEPEKRDPRTILKSCSFSLSV